MGGLKGGSPPRPQPWGGHRGGGPEPRRTPRPAIKRRDPAALGSAAPAAPPPGFISPPPSRARCPGGRQRCPSAMPGWRKSLALCLQRMQEDGESGRGEEDGWGCSRLRFSPLSFFFYYYFGGGVFIAVKLRRTKVSFHPGDWGGGLRPWACSHHLQDGDPAAPSPVGARRAGSSNFLKLLLLLPAAGTSPQPPAPKWGWKGSPAAPRMRCGSSSYCAACCRSQGAGMILFTCSGA